LANSFSDGYAMSVSPTYVPLTNGSYYSKYSDGEFPDIDWQGPLYVVSSYSAADGTIVECIVRR
jgi:hypothetical protein